MSSIIITGATGIAGSGVLRQCLADGSVRRVTVISRNPLPEILLRDNPKLEVIIHKDFANYETISESLKGHDACFWCLGISQSQVSKDEYFVITHTYAMEALKAMSAANPERFTFCFLSGKWADSTESAWTTFKWVKGKTENDLQKLGLGTVYAFRPGFIHNTQGPPDKNSIRA